MSLRSSLGFTVPYSEQKLTKRGRFPIRQQEHSIFLVFCSFPEHYSPIHNRKKRYSIWNKPIGGTYRFEPIQHSSRYACCLSSNHRRRQRQMRYSCTFVSLRFALRMDALDRHGILAHLFPETRKAPEFGTAFLWAHHPKEGAIFTVIGIAGNKHITSSV